MIAFGGGTNNNLEDLKVDFLEDLMEVSVCGGFHRVD